MLEQQNLLTHAITAQVKEFAKIKSEQDLRVKVKDAFFGDYSVDVEDKQIDFLVYNKREGFFTETFLWAESKDKPTDIFEMFAQLLLTIKKNVDAGEMPPKFLGVFDREKIAFVEFYNVLEILRLNDFNWRERPSSVSKKTVSQVEKYLKNVIVFNFAKDIQEFVGFIRENFALGKTGTSKAQINKNNFVTVFMKWVETVRPTIDIESDEQKEYGLIDGDFYLGDLLSEDDVTLSDFKDHKVALQKDCYKIRVAIVGKRKRLIEEIGFRDGGKAHQAFWARYERPPKEEFRDYMKDRRDLLVPQDVRERKGSFFTPQIWVEKSQEYLAKVFGDNWQDEYYVWDCCCGTGNLLTGLVNPYNIWASTIDQADTDIIHASISNRKCNLLKSHVFPFDFLNDDFSELPEELQDILNDEKKRKRLIIYMNPPYAEAGSSVQKKSKIGVSNVTMVHTKYFSGNEKFAKRELSVQFLMRIYKEMPGCKIGHFSKLKIVNAPYFKNFRKTFQPRLEKLFVVPANTFDNVNGQFPIGFMIWDSAVNDVLKVVRADVFDKNGDYSGRKSFFNYDNALFINDWLRPSWIETNDRLGYMVCNSNDFQHQNELCIRLSKSNETSTFFKPITPKNLLDSAIYFAVRHCIKATWLNDRDQFLFPKETYKTDKDFQNDCLIFTLFHHQNRMCHVDEINHWIPFTAMEVMAMDNFKSTFMSDFLKKRKRMSKEAKLVFEAGKALWKHYHDDIRSRRKPLINASLYEIREYFKGRDEKGRIKTKIKDDRFNELDQALKDALKALAKKIQPKVYEYGFLKR